MKQIGLKKQQTSAERVEKDVNVILETEFIDARTGRSRGRFNSYSPQTDQRVGRNVNLFGNDCNKDLNVEVYCRTCLESDVETFLLVETDVPFLRCAGELALSHAEWQDNFCSLGHLRSGA